MPRRANGQAVEWETGVGACMLAVGDVLGVMEVRLSRLASPGGCHLHLGLSLIAILLPILPMGR